MAKKFLHCKKKRIIIVIIALAFVTNLQIKVKAIVNLVPDIQLEANIKLNDKYVNTLFWANKSKMLAVKDRIDDWNLIIYNDTGVELDRIKLTGQIHNSLWSPNDEYLSSCNYNILYVYNIKEKIIRMFESIYIKKILNFVWLNENEIVFCDESTISKINVEKGVEEIIAKKPDKIEKLWVNKNGNIYLQVGYRLEDLYGRVIVSSMVQILYYNRQSRILYYCDGNPYVLRILNLNDEKLESVNSAILIEAIGYPGQAVTNDNKYYLFVGTMGYEKLTLVNIRNEQQRIDLLDNIVVAQTEPAYDDKTFAVATFDGDIYVFSVKEGLDRLFK